ncbi:MAG: glycoside hydrolase family 3 N-terminal domain-containing protein, partial [Bacillota bacterium]|nr:glycoside hydrolase family 3 N-terminal domain-containing protein [Bacillota bacterium]
MLPYQNPTLSEEMRTDDLLARMTLEEKLAQMRLTPQIDRLFADQPFSDERVAAKWPHGLGASYSPDYFDPELLNTFQQYFIRQTRLGIPLLMMGESLHGVMSPEATVFPQAIGLGATFNAPLVSRMATVIGREARSLGIRETYAPNLDLAREPRWGRTEENYGEDPYLTATMGVAYIKALQSEGVASSPKHYVAHGSPEGGINLAPVHCGERELRDTMLAPFAAAFTEAGAMSVMPAYSEWDGIPVHASRFLMTELLRDELGFDGFSVSDFGAITMLHHTHKVAPDALTAGKMALAAGLDMEAPNVFGFGPELLEAAHHDHELQQQINEAVRRILRIKFRLGLFENPYTQIEGPQMLRSQAALELSCQLARESIVLLKNEDSLLPLAHDIGKVALVGPNAREMQLGDYTHRKATERAVSLYDALLERLGHERLVYEQGSSIAAGDAAGRAAAVKAAEKADVTIVALG